MLIWISDEYQEYFATGTDELSEDQQKHKDKYNNNKYDIIYHDLNVSIIEAIISKDGQPIHYSYPHIRKYQVVILYGTARCRQSLPEKHE